MDPSLLRPMMLILNGKSAGDEPLREAVLTVRESGVPLQVRVTWESGDAARHVQEALDAGVARFNLESRAEIELLQEIAAAGADTFVAGSAIFGQPDYREVIARMKAAADAA